MGRITRWLVVWLAHWALWLLFVSQINTWELLVGAAAALVATIGSMLFGRLGLVKFRPRLRDLAQARYLPWYAVTGTVEIIHGMARQVSSRSRAPSHLAAVPFTFGREDQVAAARRALAVMYTTMTPNSIVLGIVREQELLLYHQIIPGEVLPMTQNLGAKP